MAAWAREHCARPVHASWDTVKGLFDIVTNQDAIEHTSRPGRRTAAVPPVSSCRGHVAVDTPDADDPLFDAIGLAWHHMKPVEHLWFFTESHQRWRARLGRLPGDSGRRPIIGKIVQ